MYINSGYLNNSLIDFKEKKKPLVVGCCGTYRLHKRPSLTTYRPKGRVDYQLIYIASGKAHFYFHDEIEDTVVTAGHMVVFRPKDFMRYIYYGTDQTEVFWVHFTGKDVKNIMRKYGIKDEDRVINTGTSLEYIRIYKQMIQELQTCPPNYETMLTTLLTELFILIHRHLSQDNKLPASFIDVEMEQAIQYFSQNNNTEINIEEYAASRGMSVSWFIRNFKNFTGTTPMQYIVSMRMNNAQILLETTDYHVNEVAAIVGYDNPLYFSRIFRKHKGMSPSEYKKQVKK